MSHPRHVFRTPRLPDDQVVAQMATAFSEAGIDKVKLRMQTVAGEDCGGAIDALDSDQAARFLLQSKSQLVRTFIFTFADNSVNVHVSREDGETFDKVIVDFGDANTRRRSMDDPRDERVLNFVRAAKLHLRELRAQDALSLFGPQIQSHYEIREAEIGRLEACLATILQKFGGDVAEQRRQIDLELQERRDVQNREVESFRQQEADKARKRSQELSDREAELETRIAEIDDRQARHVRRQIRKDIKDALARRADKFELTAGTRRLRRPLFWFSIILLLVFGGGLLFYTIEGAQQIVAGAAQAGSISSEPWLIAIRLAVFGLAFGSTAIFFMRWNNRWFEQHASEEFLLKRLELDLDRASWVVEMAMEWKEEKGTEIPAHLLDRLTANLFTGGQPEAEPLHPADQLASALFGTSAGATLKLPGGSEVKFDRKSVQDMDKKGTKV